MRLTDYYVGYSNGIAINHKGLKQSGEYMQAMEAISLHTVTLGTLLGNEKRAYRTSERESIRNSSFYPHLSLR